AAGARTAAVRGNLATVHRDEAASQREADAEPALGVPTRAIDLHEHLEHGIEVLRQDADAVVADTHDGAVADAPRADLDSTALVRVLGRVGEQIREHLRETYRVALERDRLARNGHA